MVKDVIDFLIQQDPQVGNAVKAEYDRQRRNIELIASENFVSEAVLAAASSVLTNKYAEGYPGKRYYGGCECVDVVENIARDRAKALFGADHVNVQPHSGASANYAVYQALCNVGDTVLGMNLDNGGHLTHGSPVNMSGKNYNFVSYGVSAEDGRIDYDALAKQVAKVRPKLLVAGASGQTRKVQNRPYIDQRIWHYGFLAGIHMQDLKFVNNGYVTEDGQVWFADVPEYSPGFSVGVLGELYLNKYMSLRLVPTLHFGDKKVIFREQTSGETESQNVKSAYLSFPVDLKFSAERFNNYRPYAMVGLSPTYDLSVKKSRPLLVKPFDCYIEVGLGCDFYLPFFKLIPELKFCFGLANLLDKNRNDLTDKSLMKFTESLDKVKSRMIVLTFYFE